MNYIDEVGKPIRVLADNGTQFRSNAWKKDLTAAGIRTSFCSIRHPQSNPTERVMRELGRMFRLFCSAKHTSWAKFVP